MSRTPIVEHCSIRLFEGFYILGFRMAGVTFCVTVNTGPLGEDDRSTPSRCEGHARF